jgi:hypothetical protein
MKTNGARHKRVVKARQRIVTYARKHGSITNAQAKKIGRFKQVYFHLYTLKQAGLLRYKGFNEWIPRKQKDGWPPLNLD